VGALATLKIWSITNKKKRYGSSSLVNWLVGKKKFVSPIYDIYMKPSDWWTQNLLLVLKLKRSVKFDPLHSPTMFSQDLLVKFSKMKAWMMMLLNGGDSMEMEDTAAKKNKRESFIVTDGFCPNPPLLMGGDSMEDTAAKKKKRKSFIVTDGFSPNPPPRTTRSPGGKVTTPGGSKLSVTEKVIVSGNSRKRCCFYATHGASSPVVARQLRRLSDLDSKQRFDLVDVVPRRK